MGVADACCRWDVTQACRRICTPLKARCPPHTRSCRVLVQGAGGGAPAAARLRHPQRHSLEHSQPGDNGGQEPRLEPQVSETTRCTACCFHMRPLLQLGNTGAPPRPLVCETSPIPLLLPLPPPALCPGPPPWPSSAPTNWSSGGCRRWPGGQSGTVVVGCVEARHMPCELCWNAHVRQACAGPHCRRLPGTSSPRSSPLQATGNATYTDLAEATIRHLHTHWPKTVRAAGVAMWRGCGRAGRQGSQGTRGRAVLTPVPPFVPDTHRGQACSLPFTHA